MGSVSSASASIRLGSGQKPSLAEPTSGVNEKIFGLVDCSPYIQSSESPLTLYKMSGPVPGA